MVVLRVEKAESSSSTLGSLASKYSTSTGIYQSLSLILNAGLMVYAHVGLSAVFVSNQRNIGDAVASSSSSSSTSDATTNPDGLACTASDQQRWTMVGPNGLTGANNKTYESSFCSTSYKDPVTQTTCLVTNTCISKCFSTLFNYTEPCADCFAEIPLCSLNDGCLVCANAPQSQECYECTLRCNQVFQNCSGLSIDLISRPWEQPNNNTNSTVDEVVEWASNEQVCEAQKEGVDYRATTTYFTVFEVLFFNSMEIAWNNDARLLAFVVVAFSFVWPYAKNVILMLAWYLPLTENGRSQILLWLRRLGKYTLIDVYIILILIVGLVLQLDLNGVPVIARAEPRPAILAFLIATLWEFVHIEWMTLFHQRTIETSQSESIPNDRNLANAIQFHAGGTIKEFRNPFLLRLFLEVLLLISVALFAVGSSLDLVRFRTALEGEDTGCVRAYNLFTFSSIAVSDLVLDRNEGVASIWILVSSFVLFVLVIPWFVHAVHALAFWFGLKSHFLFRAADALWTFSCVEVFLIALYILEYKFASLVDRLAGEEGAALFGVTSELGPGFFVLIAYTVCGGFVHYFFSNAVSGYFALDPHHKVDAIWATLFYPALTEVANANAATTHEKENQKENHVRTQSYQNKAEEDVI